MCLPHTRGGVSKYLLTTLTTQTSSPHPWGCFYAATLMPIHAFVFPTPVGVFLKDAVISYSIGGLPHTRGGVSPVRPCYSHSYWSSPHPWGCFCWKRRGWLNRRVFPTPVGVFLKLLALKLIRLGLPHTRGGVSNRANLTNTDDVSSPHPWGCF